MNRHRRFRRAAPSRPHPARGALPMRAAVAAVLESLETRLVLAAGLEISEFLAENDNGLRDEDGQRQDWIEIHNNSSAAIDLGGYYLTDDPDPAELDKWRFPSRVLQPDEYLVVFASDKNRANAAGNLHTNFKLSAEGDYLALVAPDGQT